MPSLKDQQRLAAYQARKLQIDKESLSRTICYSFIACTDYRDADTVMWYVGCRTEVRTLPALQEELKRGKRIVIPYCTYDDQGNRKLGLWRLENFSELTPGTWNIPEPPSTRRGEAGKEIRPRELDLILVPGVAFDRNGGRLGNGAGYYDRLLATVRHDTRLYGACFESQLF
ncbi:MAG TPA: 5-formyltetrahydrofolate cyclo-ligase, partial [Methylomicrobium sp.]|nr:5-formyltetrahydrofolate cyclo-ligase [Methylomicrobium sp.]